MMIQQAQKKDFHIICGQTRRSKVLDKWRDMCKYRWVKKGQYSNRDEIIINCLNKMSNLLSTMVNKVFTQCSKTNAGRKSSLNTNCFSGRICLCSTKNESKNKAKMKRKNWTSLSTISKLATLSFGSCR